jgi:DNA-binding protein H-NS
LEVAQLLQEKIKAERLALEKRLRVLNTPLLLKTPVSERRPYPPVSPKYRNPERPSETWSGRGKQPRWLVAHLKSGRRIDDFAIRKVANKR